MNSRRGWAIITVILVLSITSILLICLITITWSEVNVSQYYRLYTSAYYVAESGIERASSIINKDLRNIVNDVRVQAYDLYNSNKLEDATTNEELKEYIDNMITTRIRNYLYGIGDNSFYGHISGYKGLSGSDGTSFAEKLNPIKCYYSVNAYISEEDEGKLTSRRIVVESTGHYGSSTKTIIAKYLVNYPTVVVDVSGEYPQVNQHLNNAVTVINNGSITFNFCNINTPGTVLIGSKLLQLKNGLWNLGNLYIKSDTIKIFNNMSINGSITCDYVDDNLLVGDNTLINGNKRSIINDTFIDSFGFIPAADVSGFDESPEIKYIVYNESANLEKSVIQQEPDAVYVIIAKKDFLIDSSLGKSVNLNGIIYCNGLLKIDIDNLNLKGSIICSNADFKGNININNSGALSEEKLTEIASCIKQDIINNYSIINGDYEFTRYKWVE